MKADFLDAHDRHWDDAESLFLAQRWANADHLYGMAAECGLKRLMMVFGMKFDTVKDWPAEQSDRAHADGIWMRYEIYRSGHGNGRDYTLPPSNPFQGSWRVADRYANRINFDQARVQSHRAGAMVVCELIQKARRDGLLT